MTKQEFLRLKDVMASLQDNDSVKLFLKDLQLRTHFDMKGEKKIGLLSLVSPATGVTIVMVKYNAIPDEEPGEEAYDCLCAVLMKEGAGVMHTRSWKNETERITKNN